MLVEILGKDTARFYEGGLGGKRAPYDNLKDVVFLPGTPGRGYTLKRKLQNSAVLWLYRKKDSAIGIRNLSCRFDPQTTEALQAGLGFRPED